MILANNNACLTCSSDNLVLSSLERSDHRVDLGVRHRPHTDRLTESIERHIA
jgi:hypothetical protein